MLKESTNSWENIQRNLRAEIIDIYELLVTHNENTDPEDKCF